MKISNNKSLNDLLREAVDESAARANGNVPTPGEIERLLRNSNIRSVPVTQTLGGMLYQRLFSTPLTIGLTVMTTAAIIAFAIFAFWPRSRPQNSFSTSVPFQKTFPHVEMPFEKPANQPALAASITRPAVRTLIRETIPAEPIATADSLHPIDATPEQLEKLGIVLEDNGDIVIYKRESDKVDQFALPPTWGLRLNISKNISEVDTAGLNISESFPRLITEPDGTKRLFSFEQDTAFTQKNGDRVMYMHMMNQTQIVSPSINVNSTINIPPDSTVGFLKGGINSRISVIATDSDSKPDVENGMVSVNVDSIVSALNIDSIMAMVNLDSIMKASKTNANVNVDSAMREARFAMKNVKKILSSMHFMVDSGNSANINIEMDANSDNPADSALFSSEMRQMDVDTIVVKRNETSVNGISKIQ
ncbi:MAG TPA: hypothetical protein VGM92_09455, partial [Candidatus Kapabacteria bacterium]